MISAAEHGSHLHGSYRPDQVQFLLKPIALAPMQDLATRERQIQSGQRHYSETLLVEALPSPAYLAVFEAACRANARQMAIDCLHLAQLIAQRNSGPITVVSLMRAGTPIGVIVCQLLRTVYKRDACHYSISIIRDRGIDQVALRHILARGHAPESLVFVDGWTGKGVISRELQRAIDDFNAAQQVAIDGGLYVLSDLAGTAACAASCDDYLIPSSILNATVSGLLSRSVLNHMIGPEDFHGCVLYPELAKHDRSRRFVDTILQVAQQLAQSQIRAASPVDLARVGAISRQFISHMQQQYRIADVNLIKPGIGEATRVLLRRAPRLLLLQNSTAPALAHLQLLAREKAVPLQIVPDMPYQACALIDAAQGE
jgi:hypothetical protein